MEFEATASVLPPVTDQAAPCPQDTDFIGVGSHWREDLKLVVGMMVAFDACLQEEIAKCSSWLKGAVRPVQLTTVDAIRPPAHSRRSLDPDGNLSRKWG